MAYIVNMDELDEKGKEFREYVEENLQSKVNALLNLFKDAKWEGTARDAYMEVYTAQISELNKLTDMLEKFGYYMQFVAEKYNECNTNSQEEFKKYLDEMEAEKQRLLAEQKRLEGEQLLQQQGRV